MLSELSRREKAANIKPDPDLDVYMKVSKLQNQNKKVYIYHLCIASDHLLI